MITCTWQDCPSPADHPQVSDDGRLWASLCAEHDAAIAHAADLVVQGASPETMLRAWRLAKGGAEAIAHEHWARIGATERTQLALPLSATPATVHALPRAAPLSAEVTG